MNNIGHTTTIDPRAQLHARLPVTERRIDAAGVETAVLEGGNGPPLVLLHGTGEFAATWGRVIPDLARTHRVIVPELPGHGASIVREGALDAEHVIAWLTEIIERTCDQPPVIAGHLLGGSIALRFATTRPERMSRLILVDTYGLAPLLPSPAFGFALMRYLVRPNERTQQRMMDRCMVDTGRLHRDMGDEWEQLLAYNLDRIKTKSVKRSLKRLMSTVGSPRIPREELTALEVPTALIWGREDLQVKVRVAEDASARYGWPLHVIDGAADDPAVEQPEAFLSAFRAVLE